MVKKTLLLMAVGLVWLASCKTEKAPENKAEVQSPKAAYQEIDVTALKKMLEAEVKPQILDVRTPEEVAAGSIAGATVIDIYDPAFMEKVQALDKSQPTVVYCKVGGRSANACSMMAEAGFTQLYNLSGGFEAWKTQP